MSFHVGECVHMPGGWSTPVSQGQKFLCWEPFQTLSMYFFIGLFICILYIILYNKLVN